MGEPSFWDDFIPLFSDFDLLIPELPQHGAGKAPHELHSIKEHTDAIIELINKYNSGNNVYLMGHSLGCYLASGINESEISTIKTILLNPPNKFYTDNEMQERIQEQIKLYNEKSLSEFSQEEVINTLKLINDLFDEMGIEIRFSIQDITEDPKMIDLLVDIAKFNFISILSETKYPSLLICSENDNSIDQNLYKKIEITNELIQIESLEDSGHPEFKDISLITDKVSTFVNRN